MLDKTNTLARHDPKDVLLAHDEADTGASSRPSPSFYDPLSAADLALTDRIADETIRVASGHETHPGATRNGYPLEESFPLEVLRSSEVTKASGEGKSPLRSLPLGGSSTFVPLGGNPALPLGGNQPRPLGDIPTGDELRELDRELSMVTMALGAPIVAGELVPCVLPDHVGEGHVERKADGSFVYFCSCDNITRGLTEVYFCRVTGSGRKREPEEWLLWKIRLAARSRLIELPPPVLLPMLPEKCAKAIVACHAGVQLLLRVRQLTELRAETEFGLGYQFAGEWSGIARDQAKDGIEGLILHGVLVKLGKKTTNHRELNYYRIGDGERGAAKRKINAEER